MVGLSNQIPAAGFNGIADTIWAGVCRTLTIPRSNDGVHSGATKPKFALIANPAMSGAARGKGRPFYSGHMIHSSKITNLAMSVNVAVGGSHPPES